MSQENEKSAKPSKETEIMHLKAVIFDILENQSQLESRIKELEQRKNESIQKLNELRRKQMQENEPKKEKPKKG